jgi:hypothetical protein
MPVGLSDIRHVACYGKRMTVIRFAVSGGDFYAGRRENGVCLYPRIQTGKKIHFFQME